MKMALMGNSLIIKDADNVQFSIIKSWGKMKWDKKTQSLQGIADLELLDKLSTIVRLPPAVLARRQQLQAVQNAVDRERSNLLCFRLHDFPCNACCSNLSRCRRNNAPEPVCKRHYLEWLKEEAE